MMAPLVKEIEAYHCYEAFCREPATHIIMFSSPLIERHYCRPPRSRLLPRRGDDVRRLPSQRGRRPMMPTTTRTQPKGATADAPTATIATAANGLAAVRCAGCRKPIRDLDPIVTTTRHLRPLHFVCATQATQIALISVHLPGDTARCWYGSDETGQCPFPIVAANVCSVHGHELYGLPVSRGRGSRA